MIDLDAWVRSEIARQLAIVEDSKRGPRKKWYSPLRPEPEDQEVASSGGSPDWQDCAWPWGKESE